MPKSYVTQDQADRLRGYLETDREMHVKAHGNWKLDPGKLEAALEDAGIEIGEPPPSRELSAVLSEALLGDKVKWTPLLAEKAIEHLSTQQSLRARQSDVIEELKLTIRAAGVGVHHSEIQGFGFDLTLVEGGADPAKKVRLQEICELAPPSLRLTRPVDSHRGRQFWEAKPEERENWPRVFVKRLDHAAVEWCQKFVYNAVYKKDGTKVPLLHAMRKPDLPKRTGKRDEQTTAPADTDAPS